MGKDALETEKWIRKHQDYREAEVSFGGEADLHRHYKRCRKNPGHRHFIPIQDFKIEHLPLDYRYCHKVIFDWIRAVANLTCRLSVRYTSESRPKFHPDRQPLSFYPFYQDRGGNWLRIGTGWVSLVNKYTEKDNETCECEECRRQGTHTPKKVWGQVYINTACHVVYDSDEARHTTCHFFYDTSRTHLSQCLSLEGLSIKFSDVEGDWGVMKYVTHDMDLLDILYKMWRNWQHLCDKVSYELHDIDENCHLCVIISHPHGCSKMLTVGSWTHHRQTSEESTKKFGDDKGYVIVGTQYSYNTPTCPGSSGAPVITLPPHRRQLEMSHHLHSEGTQGNYNKSAMRKFVVDPSRLLVNVKHSQDVTDTCHPSQPLSLDPGYQDRCIDWMRIGNERVGLVNDMYTERGFNNFEYVECRRPGTHMAKLVWGKDYMNIACHVVYNSEEARYTSCHSFYDTRTTYLNHCLRLKGLSDVERDWAVMNCVTHDLDLLDKLYKKWHHWFDLSKVWGKLQSHNPEYHSVTREVCDHCVITCTSQLHGCSKQPSMEIRTCKQTSNGPREKFGDNNDFVNDFVIVATECRFNTLAWSGSSKAPVVTSLPGRLQLDISHYLYSEGNPGNDSESAVRKFLLNPSRCLVSVEHTLGLHCFAQFSEVNTTRMKDCGYYLHFTPKCTVPWSITDKEIAVTKYMIF